MRTTLRPAQRSMLILSTELVLGPMVPMMEVRRCMRVGLYSWTTVILWVHRAVAFKELTVSNWPSHSTLVRLARWESESAMVPLSVLLERSQEFGQPIVQAQAFVRMTPPRPQLERSSRVAQQGDKAVFGAIRLKEWQQLARFQFGWQRAGSYASNATDTRR